MAYDHFVQSSLLSSVVKADCSTAAEDNLKTTVSKAAPAENYYLKTPRQSSVSARSEVRDFSNTLFVSSFNYSKSRNISKVSNRNFYLQFVAIGLKIIYPYHYFW
jgi:hypothetical protein